MIKLDLIKQPPNTSLINYLENLLINAKSGELQEIVYVCSYRGNFVNHGWTKLTNRMRLIGELEQVKWHLLSLDK
jgi:hypothetical protein